MKECVHNNCNSVEYRGTKDEIQQNSAKNATVNWIIASFKWNSCGSGSTTDLGNINIKATHSNTSKPQASVKRESRSEENFYS